MRTLSLLLLSGALMTACVDRDYDLSDLDFDNVAIGDENSEFRIPLATVQVSMDEIAENGVNIEAIFREADIWLPSSEKEVNLPALTGDSDYRDGLIGNTIAEMRQNPEKLDGVVRLTYEKYYDEFAGAIGIEESGIPLEEYTEAFKTALELSADEIETRIKQVASDYLKTIDIEPVEYEIGHIDLDDEVIDMLSDNLDPEGTPDAKNTLHIYGSPAGDDAARTGVPALRRRIRNHGGRHEGGERHSLNAALRRRPAADRGRSHDPHSHRARNLLPRPRLRQLRETANHHRPAARKTRRSETRHLIKAHRT